MARMAVWLYIKPDVCPEFRLMLPEKSKLRWGSNCIRVVVILFSLMGAIASWAQRPLGGDVSGYQTSVNWTTVENAGIVFAWSKATEGTYYVNPYFTSQESGARGVGIYIGAYHFARPSDDPNLTGANSAQSEANYYWSVASSYCKPGGGYLVPMLDWEDTGATNGYPNFTAAYMSSWVNEWCDTVSNDIWTASGVVVRPVVYTGTWYSEASSTYPGLTTAVTALPNWMSDYPSSPNAQTGSPSGYTYPWSSWNIWQYADTNASGGDSDVFNGTWSQFVQLFAIGGTNAPAFTANPTNISVGLGSNVTFYAKASGTTPLSFHWMFNGTVISGITSSNYTVDNVQLTNAGGYTVVASNAYGNVLANPAFLSVIPTLTNAPNAALAPTNLINWWPADGNPNDIYGVSNATPFGSLSYTNGEKSLAFKFNGSGSYLLVSNATELSPNWTLCLWVNRQNAPGASSALLGDGTYAIKVEQYNTTRQVGMSYSGVGDYLFNPGCTVPAGKWTHLAFVATSTSVMLYSNAVLVGSTNVSSFKLPRSAIGEDSFSGSPSDYMNGAVDEIQVFSRALAASEIKSIYSAGSNGLVSAPQFTGVVFTNGVPQLSLRGLTGKNITVQGSTDLINWSSLSTLSNPTGTVQYLDTSGLPLRFYQATQSH